MELAIEKGTGLAAKQADVDNDAENCYTLRPSTLRSKFGAKQPARKRYFAWFTAIHCEAKLIFKRIRTLLNKLMRPSQNTPEPILDRTGQIVAHFDGHTLSDDNGNVIAYCESESICVQGSIVGVYRCGLFLDLQGHVVGFQVGALGTTFSMSGRHLPTSTMAVPAAFPPIPRQGWSTKSWHSFVKRGS